MALKTAWTVRVHKLATQLRVGIYPHEFQHQPIIVSMTLRGLYNPVPATIDQCLDYEPICRWITNEWPQSDHTPLLETRANELLIKVFGIDKRIQNVWIGLYKTEAIEQAARVGLEREMSRRQFETQAWHPLSPSSPLEFA